MNTIRFTKQEANSLGERYKTREYWHSTSIWSGFKDSDYKEIAGYEQSDTLAINIAWNSLSNYYQRIIIKPFWHNKDINTAFMQVIEQDNRKKTSIIGEVMPHFCISMNGDVFEGLPIGIANEAPFTLNKGSLFIYLILDWEEGCKNLEYKVPTKVKKSLQDMIHCLSLKLRSINTLGAYNEFELYQNIHYGGNIAGLMHDVRSSHIIPKYSYAMPRNSGNFHKVSFDEIIYIFSHNNKPAPDSLKALSSDRLKKLKMDLEEYYSKIIECMKKYQINTAIRQAHFLANVGEETGLLSSTTQGDKVNSIDMSVGRGLLMFTGQDVYEQYGLFLGLGINYFVENPKLIATEYAVDSAGWFWSVYKKRDNKDLNKMADTNFESVLATCNIVNGNSKCAGCCGKDNREKYFGNALFIFNLKKQ